MVSYNSGGSGTGQFSTLSELIDDALREMGESSPTVLKNLESERFLKESKRNYIINFVYHMHIFLITYPTILTQRKKKISSNKTRF